MMRYTRGEYTTTEKYFGVLMGHSKHECEIVLIESGQVYSAFKKTEDGKEFGFLKADAKKLFQVIDKALKKCKSKNGQPMPFVLGSSMMHSFTLAKGEFNFEIFDGSIVGAEVYLPDNKRLTLEYTDQESISGLNIPYIPLTVATPKKTSGTADDSNLQESNEADEVVVRSVAEIAMEKEDISWLKNKKYYIVNDDDYAEQIFSAIEKLNTEVSYDTETTGLRINCFSKINSSYEAQLAEWNNSHSKDEQIRADRLVGIIFSVEENVSYYFPVFNRKFKNLYTTDSASRKKAVDMIYERYRDEEFCKRHPDMADYFHKTPSSQWRSDAILMERVRFILEYLHIVAHNGSFEWKVSWCYEICLNLQDDTMIMHQIMYKFRSTTSNKGEPSNLKYLSKVELGIDQWELSDFFPDYADDDSGLAISNKKSRKKKKNSKIDFSYMTYEGTRVYAPTDGDATLLLCHKYKKDLLENHREQEYLYNVEIIVACCIAYMEFYGIRIDEEKIYGIRDQTKAEIACIESEIRQKVGYSGEKELEAYNSLKAAMEGFNRADQAGDSEARKLANENTLKHVDSLYKAIAEDEEHILNLASPAQVATLFYDVLGYPFQGEKKSVAKKEIKPLLKMKNEDGSPMYPVANMYSDYKAKDTLMTKFFDNLPYFMYPGGLVFAHFGQISTATGRMSCNKPNLQQMPKAITKIMCPRPGNIMIDADYSQIEYRVLTALAENEGLLRLFSDPDSDYHTLMASLMYGVDYAAVTPKMRSDAKSFNFGIPYGMGIKSLAILLTGNSKPSSVAEAKEKYELYFKNQPKTRQFFDNVKEMANVRGYTKTHWNRYRYYSFTNPDGTQNNARKAAALRQAGNAIIQGTAADIFKISVARNYMYIKENWLFGKLFIVNMIHDEQLFEVNPSVLNSLRVLADIGRNMQFKLEGFPPLFIGAGVGKAWGEAKGKMAEIHPMLLDEFMKEAESLPLYNPEGTKCNPADVIKYFSDRVYEFRRQKVIAYLTNPDNFGKEVHPAIGNLLNLQFTYGHDKGKEGLDDKAFTNLCIDEFIKHNNLTGIDSSMFIAKEESKDVEEDKEYEDNEDSLDSLEDIEIDDSIFTVVDESDVAYGVSIQDLIKNFKFFVSEKYGVCGIDAHDLSYQTKDNLITFLVNHMCDENSKGAMELVFLQSGNILKHTGCYVSNITNSDIEEHVE